MAKKLLAMLLAVVMAFSLLPVSALAAELETGENEPAAEQVFEETDVIPPEKDEPALPEEEAIQEDIPAEEAEDTSPDEEIPEEDEALFDVDTDEQALRAAFAGNDTWVELRTDIELTHDLTIPEDFTLYIVQGRTLTVPEGITLYNNGIINAEGNLIVNGTYSPGESAKVFQINNGNVEGPDYESVKSTSFDKYSDDVTNGKIDSIAFNNAITKGDYPVVWVDINGVELDITQDTTIAEGVEVRFNSDWETGNGGALCVGNGAVLTVDGKLGIYDDNLDLTVDGLIFVSYKGCADTGKANGDDYFYECDNHMIVMWGRGDDPCAVSEDAFSLILKDMNWENRRQISVADSFTIQGGEDGYEIPEFADVYIRPGCTLTIDTDFILDGQIIVAGKLVVNGLPDKDSKGRVVALSGGVVEGFEYRRVLETAVNSEAGLRAAIDEFLDENNGYSEAWVNIDGEVNLVIENDIYIPEGMSLNFHSNEYDGQYYVSTLTIKNNARFETSGWMNCDNENPSGRFVVENGTMVILGGIGFDPNAIVSAENGRVYDFGNNGGQVGLRDQRDINEVITYSEYIHDAYIWMEGDITIDRDFVIGDYTIATGEGNTLTVAEGVHVKNCGRIDLRGTLDVLGTFDNSEGIINFVSANAKITGNGPDANCKRLNFLEILPETEYTVADVVNAMENSAGYDEVWVDLYKPLTLSQDLVIPGNAHIAFFEGGKLTVTGSSEVRCSGGLQYLNGENCIVLQNTSVLAFYGWQNEFRDDDEMQSVVCEDDALFLDYTRGGVWAEDAGLLCKAVEFAPSGFCMIMAAGEIVLGGDIDLTIPAGCNIIVVGELSLEGAKVINNGQIQVYGTFNHSNAGEFENYGELLACSENGEHFGTIYPEEDSKKNITVSSGDFDKLRECVDGINEGLYDSVFFNVDGEVLNITEDITIPEGMSVIVNSAGGDNNWSEGRVKVSWCTLTVEGEIIISEDCRLEVGNGGSVVIYGLSNIYSNRYYRDYRIEGSGSVELFLDNAGLEVEGAEQTFRFLTGWESCFTAPSDGWYSFTAVEGEGLPVRSLDMFVGDEQLSGTVKRVLYLGAGDTISMMVQLYGGDASMETDLKIKHLSEDEVISDYTINTGAWEDITIQNGVIWEIPVEFTAPDPNQTGYDGYYVGTFLSTDKELFGKGDGANWVETDSNRDIPRDNLILQYFSEPAPDGKLTATVLGPVPGMTYYYASALFYMGADGVHVCGEAIETEPKSFTVRPDAEITEFAVNDEAGLWPNDVMLAKFTAADAGQYIARLSGNGFIAMRDSTGLLKDFQEYYNDQTPGSADTVCDAAANDTFYITVFPTSRSQFTVISASDTKNKVKAGSNSMKDSVLYSFTSEADSIATFSFAGTKNLNSFSILRNGQWFDFGYGKDTATLAFTDAETVYVKASVEGAEEQTPVKLKITNSALAMNAGLTVIAYPLEFEDPDFEYLRNIVPISNDGYFTDSDNWESFAIYSNVINKADPDKTFTLYPLILDSTYRVLNVDNSESATATGALANVKFKWSVSGASVATVKQAKNENIATLTLKKGAAGVALVSATTTDKLKVAGSMAVHIMDYAPRLDSAKLTMNTFLKEPYAVAGLHPGYPEIGYGIESIEVYEYNGKTVSNTPSERFKASYDSAAEQLIITPVDNTDVIANSSIKLRLKINHFNGDEPSKLDVTLTVKNTMPTFSVKTVDPVNYAQGIGGLLFISSNDIMNKVIQLGDSQFVIDPFDDDDSDLTGISLFVNYGDGSQIWDGVTKIVSKTTLRVTFGEYKDGYNTVDKVVSIGCNKNAPSIKLDAKEVYFNKMTDLDEIPYVSYYLTDAGEGVEVAVTPSGKLRTDAFEVSDFFYRLVFELKDGCELPANGKYAYTVQLVKDGQPVKGSKAASVTLIVTDAQPKVTLKASGKLDLIDPEYSGIVYQMKLSNFYHLGELILGGPDADMFNLAGPNLIMLKSDKEYSTKKTYSFSFTPVLGDGTQLAPINQKVKVTQSTLKLLVTPKQNLFYQTKGRDKTLEYTISVASPSGGRIDWDSISVGTVKFWQRSLYDSTKDINFRLNGDCTELTVYITLKDTAKLKAGSYTLPIELKPMFAQDGTKPVKANLSMKVVK